MFETQKAKKIKILRSDNGTEYTNRELTDFLNKKGIIHQTSVPYCPEQNGKSESEFRTIVEAGRTLLIDSRVKKVFWAEAVNTAVYVLNRTGTSSQPDKTPYELWHNKTFDL